MTPGLLRVVDSLFARARLSAVVRELLFGPTVGGLDLAWTAMLVGTYHDSVRAGVLYEARVLDGAAPETRDVVAAYALLARTPPGPFGEDRDAAGTGRAERRRNLRASLAVEAARLGYVSGVAHAASAAFDAVAEALGDDLTTMRRDDAELDARELRRIVDADASIVVSADLGALAALSFRDENQRDAHRLLRHATADDRRGVNSGPTYGALRIPGDPRKSAMRFSGEEREALAAWRECAGA